MELSGEGRAAGEKRLIEVKGISRLSCYRLKSGFLIRLLDMGLDRGANRAVTYDLADGARRRGLLAGVQVRSAPVLDLADPCDFFMVVENFGRKEVDFTREQQAHNQGAHPEFPPIFSPASHSGFALSLFGLNMSA